MVVLVEGDNFDALRDLRLFAFAVVAIGFERLVWERV